MDPPAPTVESLQKDLAAEVGESKKYRHRAQAAETKVETLQGHVLTDEDRALFDTLKTERSDQEQKALEDKGKFEEALAKVKTDHTKAIDALDRQVLELTEALQQEVGTNKLHAALGTVGVKPELIDQAARLLGGQLKVTLADGKASVEVVNSDGSPMLGGDGSPLTIEELAKGWVEKNPHFLPPSGDVGSGAHQGPSVPDQVTLAQLDADAEKKAAFIAKDGGDAYAKLIQADRLKKREADGK